MARNKLKETTFPSLNQTGETSSLDLILGYVHVDHIFFRGARQNWGWCSGALNKAAFPLTPSLDALLLLWGSLSCKHKSSTSKAKDKSPAK